MTQKKSDLLGAKSNPLPPGVNTLALRNPPITSEPNLRPGGVGPSLEGGVHKAAIGWRAITPLLYFRTLERGAIWIQLELNLVWK